MVKARGPSDAMDAAQKPPHPLPVGCGPQFGPAAAAPRENRVSETSVDVQRLRSAIVAVPGHRRHHRDFLRRQLRREGMLLANGCIAPATGPIEFGDHWLAILD